MLDGAARLLGADQATQRRLGGLDSAFLSVETDAAPMHVTAVATLEPTAPGRPAWRIRSRSFTAAV